MLTAITRYYLVYILICLSVLSCRNSKDYVAWQDNYDSGMRYIDKDSIRLALPHLSTAYHLAKDSLNSKNRLRNTLVKFYNANVALKKFDIIDSLELTDMLLKSSKGLNKKKLLNYSVKLDQFADSLANNRQYSNAIKLYERRKLVLCNYNLKNSNGYAKALFDLGKTYKATRKNNLKAKEYFEEALGVVNSNGSSFTTKKEDILKSLVSIYISLGKNTKAFDAAERTLKIIDNNLGVADPEYTNSLNEFAIVFWRSGLLEKAAEYENRVIDILESIGDTNSDFYQVANFVLALVEKGNNNYLKALDALKRVQKIMIELNDTDSDGYAQLLGEIGIVYERMGDFENAFLYYDRSLKVPGISKRTTSLRLMDKGYFYQNTGQYTKSHQFYNLALESMKISHGYNDEKYAKLLNNIGKLYFEENNFNEAVVYFKNAMDINERPEGEKWHNDYSYMLNDYAITLLELGDNEKAIRLMEKNLNYFEKENEPKNEEYYNRKYSLGRGYNLNKDYDRALPLIQEATQNLKLILGEDHVDYGDFLKTLSSTFFGLGMNKEGVSAILESNKVFVDQIDKIFQFSSEQEKASFIKMITNNFNQMQSVSQNEDIKDTRLDITNLNNQLMLKGLLLNNSKDILSKLGDIDNDSIKHKITDYKNDKRKLSKLLTQYNSDNKEAIDDLKANINRKETELVKYYSTNFEGGISLNRNWEDVRIRLNEDEVAIEFAHYNEYQDNKSTGEISYVAYIITKEQDKPTVIPLFNEKELLELLDKRSPNSLYAVRGSKGKSMKSTNGLYNLVWLPIENYLKTLSPKKRVYFALSGILNQIPMSALGTKEKPILSHQYDLYQMGSTHNLITGINKKNNENILLIGGVDYNKNSDESQRDDSKWDELPGTLNEVESIEKILLKNGKKVSLWKAHNASEGQFKDLDGQSPSLIHIATHGFFFQNPETSKSSIDGISNIYRSSKDPLLRSGLILSGANDAWENNNFYSDNEDGILTAMEIANLDLSKTSIVVLSACETGLGDINGSEGVYGLQRAFKMAGVDTLIMSLWQVPDKETAIFMETFYKNWNEDNTIRAAFIETQRSLSKKYKNDPYKWAAFVLFE